MDNIRKQLGRKKQMGGNNSFYPNEGRRYEGGDNASRGRKKRLMDVRL